VAAAVGWYAGALIWASSAAEAGIDGGMNGTMPGQIGANATEVAASDGAAALHTAPGLGWVCRCGR
jgi:hypothetical protein